jgi:hypothetical protein
MRRPVAIHIDASAICGPIQAPLQSACPKRGAPSSGPAGLSADNHDPGNSRLLREEHAHAHHAEPVDQAGMGKLHDVLIRSFPKGNVQFPARVATNTRRPDSLGDHQIEENWIFPSRNQRQAVSERVA